MIIYIPFYLRERKAVWAIIRGFFPLSPLVLRFSYCQATVAAAALKAGSHDNWLFLEQFGLLEGKKKYPWNTSAWKSN